MANPNLLNATSIYGKNVTVSADGSLNTILTCPSNKLIKIISITVHNVNAPNAYGIVKINDKTVGGGGSNNPPEGGLYTLGSFYLTESQTIKFHGIGSGIDCVISYEEIDDA